MKKIFLLFSIVLIFVITLNTLPLTLTSVSADEIEDLQKEIDKLSEAKKLSQSATKPLEGQLENLQKQLIQIQYNIELLGQKIIKKEKDLDARKLLLI